MKTGALKTDIKLKDGTRFFKDSVVTVDWNKDGRIIATIDNREFKTSGRFLKNVSGFTVPNERKLEDWHESGYCKSITGKHVEPDGYGPDGSPSWLIALGYI